MDAFLRLLHTAVFGAWFMGVVIWYDRSVWFMSGALAWSWVAAAVCVLGEPALPSAQPAPRPRGAGAVNRRRAWAMIVTSVLAFVFVGFYAGNLISAVYDPDASPSTFTRQHAATMWDKERALVILVWVLQGVTAFMHVASVGYYGHLLATAPSPARE
jgi:hypothetical protein